MEMALVLAETGAATVSPNPIVGAIIVKENRVIGKGVHLFAGGSHAEIVALESCTESPEGATLYITLEPCDHTGLTGPCTKQIIEAKIQRVVVAMEDPNPLVQGKGIRRLREAGITVVENVCLPKALQQNESFVHYITTQTPFVMLKCASTLDGFIATRTGDSKWISNTDSRKMAHLFRHRADAILVGKNTALQDNPLLTTRLGSKKDKQPIRIVLDNDLFLATTDIHLTTTAKEAPTWIVSGKEKESSEFMSRKKSLEEKGVRVVRLPYGTGKVSFPDLMKYLGSQKITRLLVEGGGEIAHSALWSGVVQKIIWFLTPQVLGGNNGISVFQGDGAKTILNCPKLYHASFLPIEENWMVTAYTSPQSFLR